MSWWRLTTEILVGLSGIFVFAGILAGAFGAYGWPTDPRWLILTGPIGLALASAWLAALVKTITYLAIRDDA